MNRILNLLIVIFSLVFFASAAHSQSMVKVKQEKQAKAKEPLQWNTKMKMRNPSPGNNNTVNGKRNIIKVKQTTKNSQQPKSFNPKSSPAMKEQK